MRALFLALLLTACGRTPTAPKPCTPANAVRVDTAYYPIFDPAGVLIGRGAYLAYWCKP